MSPGYTVLHEAGPPHVCDLPSIDDFYSGTVVECNDCGVSYVADRNRSTPSWVRRPKPASPKPEERA